MMNEILDAVTQYLWIYLLLVLVSIIILLTIESRDPRNVLLWALVFIVFPVIGFVVYLIIGRAYYSQYTFGLKGIKDEKFNELMKIEERLMDSGQDSDMAHTMKNLGATGYTNNNSVELITEGEDYFENLFRDLREAKDFIHCEFFLIRYDHIGNEFLNILTEKVKEGVEVKLMVDDLGMKAVHRKEIKEFKRAGGQFVTFHRVSSLILSPRKNNRCHRKIVVIDGVISYCGGMNIGTEFIGESEHGYWRDAMVRMRGGACIPLEFRFEMDWTYATKEDFPTSERYFSRWEESPGSTEVQIVSGGPDVRLTNPIRMQFIEMLRQAKRSAYIQTPYFFPDKSIMDAIRAAAADGVEVIITVPDRPDHFFVHWNTLSGAYDAMDAGARVFLFNNGYVHSKTLVVDGRLCLVGSSNMNGRSMIHDFETNAMIYSEQLAHDMEEVFFRDLQRSTEYTREDFENRTFGQKVRTVVSRLFRDLS